MSSIAEPDQVIHGEPWWTSNIQPERHRWSVRCVRYGDGWVVNIIDLPTYVRDPLVLAAALNAADAWIARQPAPAAR